MMKSMTAFSNAQKTQENLTVNVEIRSYNHRYLDITLRIPQGYISLEDKIKNLISERITRGHLEVRIQIKETSEDSCAYEIDESRASAYHKAIVQLKNRFDIQSEITLELLTGGTGIIKPVEMERDMDVCWQVMGECMNEALYNLEAMRKKEGDFILRDFESRLGCIEKYLDEIEKVSDNLFFHYQDRLKERVLLLTRGIVELDPERIEQEAAFLADRSDISEEILRSRSHISQFRDIMNSPEPAGRKLNFLLQEFNREFNTMGSKAGNTEVSHTVVTIKSELEKIREQVQNVE